MKISDLTYLLSAGGPLSLCLFHMIKGKQCKKNKKTNIFHAVLENPRVLHNNLHFLFDEVWMKFLPQHLT